MTIGFRCRFCGTIVRVDEGEMGTEVQCGSCSEIITVPASFLSPGVDFDGFLILEELKADDFVVIFVAVQMCLNRFVVLKVLHGRNTDKPDVVVNFINDARNDAKYYVPHPCSIISTGECYGYFYQAWQMYNDEEERDYILSQKMYNDDEEFKPTKITSPAIWPESGKGYS